MTIPPFDASGLLPAYVGADPTIPAARSPHAASSLDVVTTFATSAKRCELLGGWLRYRAALHGIGMIGFQWIDGSFCEDLTRARPPRDPNDIDLITFFGRATGTDALQFDASLKARPDLHPGKGAREAFGLDVYYEALHGPNTARIDSVHYWYGLFSHRKVDSAYKGILRVELPTIAQDDVAATVALNRQVTALHPQALQVPTPTPSPTQP